MQGGADLRFADGRGYVYVSIVFRGAPNQRRMRKR